MPTKIINILRDDDFDSVFNVFEGTSAKEVIFILPKNSRFASKAEHFLVIKEKAQELDKTISIMSGDKKLKEFIEELGFKFLEIEKSKPKRKLPETKEVALEPVTPSSAWARRGMSDIIRPVSDTKIAVEPEETEEDEKLELNVENAEEEKPLLEEVPEEPMVEAPEEPEALPEPEAPTITPLDKSKSSDLEQLWFGLAKTSRKLKERMPQTMHHRRISRKKITAIGTAAAAVIAIVAIFTMLASAHIILRPAKQAINFEMTASAASNVSKTDTSKNIIPGQYMSVEDSATQTFNATGHDDVVKKSEGTIKIVNDLPSKQVLVATTRFESPSGKLYRISETITVPANGSAQTKATADKAGKEYAEKENTRFSIPGFKEAKLIDKFENIYAVALTNIDGGFIGEASLVTEEDFNMAKSALFQNLAELAQQKLKQQIKNFGLENLATEVVVKDIKTTAEMNDVAENFEMTMKVEARTMLFDKSNIAELINAYLTRSGGLEMVESLTNVRYTDAAFDEKDMVSFKLIIDGQAAPHIDKKVVMENMLGKDKEGIHQYVRDLNDKVTSAKILLSPPWIRHVPKDLDRVRVDFEY